jgi:endogenous inhibitor of DNA gyrase (YacG/DUF329 family)
MTGDENAPRPVPPRQRRACPVCGRPSSHEDYPFCSKRCADVDLNRWLSEAYAIPAAETDEEDGPGQGEAAQSTK